MENIVIAGAGFAGLQTALGLSRAFGRSGEAAAITLADRHDYQMFNSNLYEVAVADEELTSVSQLEHGIAVPVLRAIKNSKIKFIQGEIGPVDLRAQRLAVGSRQVEYDCLVLALGSVSDFFGIEGADRFALPLKSLPDALRVRNQIEFVIERHRQDAAKRTLRMLVAGGGYTGVEFIGELAKSADLIAWKNSFPREKVELEIIEATNRLIPGLNDRLSADAYERLKDLGVHVRLLSPIAKIDEHYVELASGERILHDVLVWATGVKARGINFNQEVEKDKKGRLSVNEFLQLESHPEVFVAGDLAGVVNSDGSPVPSTAQDALHEAQYLAYAIPRIMQNKRPRPYRPSPHGFIVAIGGKWAIVCLKNFYIKGFLGYLVRQAANLDYYASVVGWWQALKEILFQMKVFGRND